MAEEGITQTVTVSDQLEVRPGDPPILAANASGSGKLQDKTLAELLKDLSEQTSTLVSKELELAKAELTAKGKRLGLGVGILGGAGLMLLLGLGSLTACVIAALSLAMPIWLAALIVALALLAIGGGLGLAGKAEIQRGAPPVPEEAVKSTKEDLAWIKAQAKSAKP
jgi:uncharacterized membrane protein YqjE